jgi:hypothetical protein
VGKRILLEHAVDAVAIIMLPRNAVLYIYSRSGEGRLWHPRMLKPRLTQAQFDGFMRLSIELHLGGIISTLPNKSSRCIRYLTTKATKRSESLEGSIAPIELL